jgi:hypothetical protein
MVTHTRECSAEIESELALIDNRISRIGGDNAIYGIIYGKSYKPWMHSKYKGHKPKFVIQKEIFDEAQEHLENIWYLEK